MLLDAFLMKQVSSEQGRLAAFPSKGGGSWFCRGRLLLDNVLLGEFDGLGFAGDWLFGDWFGWHGKKTSLLIAPRLY
jgi:hypothetical protein